MKIQIANTTSQHTNFGYNKQYHTEVEQYLASRSKQNALARYLIEMDKLSLETEDDIVNLEKSKKTATAKYSDLTTFLQKLKSNVAFFTESYFKDLQYCDNLIVQYLKESMEQKIQRAQDWRTALCQELSRFSTRNYSSLFEVKDKEQNRLEAELKANGSIGSNSKYDSKDTFSSPKSAPIKAGSPNQKNKSEEAFERVQSEYDDLQKLINDMQNVLTPYSRTASSPKGFDDIVGMKDVKERLQDEIVEYVKNPEQAHEDYFEYGIELPKGYLFYGPPGCGKTYITHALSEEANLMMFKMDVSKVGSSYVNQTPANIEKAFDGLSNLSQQLGKPVILFLDEVDSLAIKREDRAGNSPENLKTTATLLKLIEGARDNGIILIAATNKIDLLDDAFKSRFGEGQILFPLPDRVQIENLLVRSLISRNKGMALAYNDDEIARLSNLMEGYSNRTIVHIVDNAAKRAKKDGRRDIEAKDFDEVIKEGNYDKVEAKNYKKAKKSVVGFCQ